MAFMQKAAGRHEEYPRIKQEDISPLLLSTILDEKEAKKDKKLTLWHPNFNSLVFVIKYLDTECWLARYTSTKRSGSGTARTREEHQVVKWMRCNVCLVGLAAFIYTAGARL